MPVAREVDGLLRKAIGEKRLVELVYNEKRRVVEPHDYGVVPENRICLRLLGLPLAPKPA